MSKNELQEIDLKIEELRLGVVKNTSAFQLSSAGGVLTIAKAFFGDAESHLLVYSSVGMFILSVLITLSISESIIRRIGPKPSTKLLQKITLHIPTSVDSEFTRSIFSGLFSAVGFAIFFYFLLIHG